MDSGVLGTGFTSFAAWGFGREPADCDSLAIAGYCGDTPKLDKAIAKFAALYADQMTKDYAVFIKAIKAGKVKTAGAG